jgi:hypothetical protein
VRRAARKPAPSRVPGSNGSPRRWVNKNNIARARKSVEKGIRMRKGLASFENVRSTSNAGRSTSTRAQRRSCCRGKLSSGRGYPIRARHRRHASVHPPTDAPSVLAHRAHRARQSHALAKPPSPPRSP